MEYSPICQVLPFSSRRCSFPSQLGNTRVAARTTSFLRFRDGILSFPTVIIASSHSEIFITQRIVVSNRLNSNCSIDMVRIHATMSTRQKFIPLPKSTHPYKSYLLLNRFQRIESRVAIASQYRTRLIRLKQQYITFDAQ